MKIISFDWETFYDSEYTLKKLSTSEYILDPRFKALGFAISVDGAPAQWVNAEGVRSVLDRIGGQLRDCVLLAHHAHFDAAILAWHFGIRCRGYLDTMLMARAKGLQAAVGGSLKALCLHFGLGEKPDLRPDSTPEELRLRGTWDCDATYKLFKILAAGFPQKELLAISRTVEQYIQRKVVADLNALDQILVEERHRKDHLLAEIHLTEEDLRSPALFADAIIKLGYEPPMKPSPADPSRMIWALAKTDQGMNDLLEHDDPEVAALAAARLGVKASAEEDRAKRLIRLAELTGDDTLPVYYNYYGAHTGRWQGGDKTNFANMKRGGAIRDCLFAEEGHVFVTGDMSQIECRLTGWLFGEENLVGAFRDKRDVYCEFATMAYHKPVTKADEFERFSGKTTVLGSGFGAGGPKIAAQMRAEINKRRLPFPKPTDDEGVTLVDAFRKMYYRIPQGWKLLESGLTTPGLQVGPIMFEKGAILLPSGLRIHYPNLQWERWETMGGELKTGWRYDGKKGRTALWGGSLTENVIQALARIHMRDAMLWLYERGWTTVLHTYDEIVLSVPEDRAVEAEADLRYALTTPPEWAKGLPLACEAGVGICYGEIKKH